MYRCPKCRRKGQWRRGVGFDHEMICMDCHEVWEPGSDSNLAGLEQMKQSIARTTVGKLIDAILGFGVGRETIVTVHGHLGVRLTHQRDIMDASGVSDTPDGVVMLVGDDHTTDNYLSALSTNLSVTESQRQLVIMALAHLAVERPGWDDALKEITSKIDNADHSMYEEFKRLHTVIDLGDHDIGGEG